jgi:hypothetical protein
LVTTFFDVDNNRSMKESRGGKDVFRALVHERKARSKSKTDGFLARQDGLIPLVGQFAALLFYLSFHLVHKAHATACSVSKKTR